MSIDPAAVVLGAAGCGAAGLLVPVLIARIPEPAPDPEHPKTAYAEVAGHPGLARTASLVSAVAGGLVGAAIGLDWPLLFLLPLVPVGVALALIDLRTRLLPTALLRPTFVGVVLLAVLAAWLGNDADALLRAGIGAVTVFAVFFALWWIHPPGMGYGDVRLSGLLGFVLAYLGWPEVLIGIYGAFLAFALPALLVVIVRRDRRLLAVAYPFGPFLLGGALAGIVLGDPLWSHLVGG